MRGIAQAMLAAALLALVACGSKEEAGGAAGAPGRSGAAEGAQAQQADESVAAALQSQGTPLATLRFLLPVVPVAGKAFPMVLSFASPQGTALQAQLESLDLVVTPESIALEFAAPDTPVTQELAVTAREAGIASLTVRISSAESATGTVYEVPVLVLAEAP